MATLAKYPSILPKLRYLPKVRLNIRHFLTLTKGPAAARGSAFRPSQRSGSGRRVKSNLRLNTDWRGKLTEPVPQIEGWMSGCERGGRRIR